MFGYAGKILKIDLSSGKIIEEPFHREFAKKFLGGNGFAAKLIFDSLNPPAGPFSRSNPVIFTTGPLNGSKIWGSGRGHAASISPLTGFFADSNYGGDFASMVKNTGYDAIMITGKSDTPVYISINENKVVIKNADRLWGKTTEEAISILKNTEGRDRECAVIGPAGENLVLFANIVCSGKRLSVAGRGGLGAVLGSKNCKGLVVYGGIKTEIYSNNEVGRILKNQFNVLKENSSHLTKYGTPFYMKKINEHGKLGTRNNLRETFDLVDNISGEIIEEKYKIKNTACFRCPVACGKIVKIEKGAYKGTNSKMPEYETLYSLGSMLEISDINSIFNGNLMCDLMGVDTISMGLTLSFVAECFDNGFRDTDYPDYKFLFGDKCNLTELIGKTANRDGFGDILALGSERIAERFGEESKKFLYSVKGMEIAGHSARGLPHMGLAYATSTRGGSHHDARPKYYDPELKLEINEVVSYCINNQHYTAIGDSLVMCRFIMERGFGREINNTLTGIINAVTGLNFQNGELDEIGERIYNLERLINVKFGVDRKKDNLPHRVFNDPIPAGNSKGMHCQENKFDLMLDLYYKSRGWDENGIPGTGKLTELGIAAPAKI